MKGVVSAFRQGRHHQKENHVIAHLDGVESRESAKELVGKSADWKTETGKIISGKVADAHGNGGAVRIIFDKGLPGQALESELEVKS